MYKTLNENINHHFKKEKNPLNQGFATPFFDYLGN
jgi:hypothetical protein